MHLTLPTLLTPAPIKLTNDQLEIRRREIRSIYQESHGENNNSINSSQSHGSFPV